jgi:arsenate reductase (thioredoxin)
MAAALLERYAQGRVSIRSAGSQPADSLDPTVVAAMHEVGVDLTGQLPKALTGGMVAEADVVITMGCGDSCPVVPGKCYEDWDLRDPAGRSVDEVRAIRDRSTRASASCSAICSARCLPSEHGLYQIVSKSLPTFPNGEATLGLVNGGSQ